METKKVACSSCNDTGWNQCFVCGGTGKQSALSVFLQEGIERSCLHCGGSGKVKCAVCGGTGYVERSVFQIPTGFGAWERSDRRGLGLDPVGREPIIRLRSTDLGSSQWVGLSRSRDKVVAKPTGATTSGVQAESKGAGFTALLAGILSGVIPIAIIVVFFLAIYTFAHFGFERTLVAVEGFFLSSVWAGLRLADLFRRVTSNRLENFRDAMAMGFGLCCGVLTAFLILTTPEGQALTVWVTSQTNRIIGSLFASIFGLGVLELIWRKIVQWVTSER